MTTLYRVYDAAGRLLYVGITGVISARLGEHNAGPWMHHAAKITLERYDDRETAEAAERSAIRDEDPVFNFKGRPVERFMQWMVAYPDGHADDVSPEHIEEVSREVDRCYAELLRSVPRSAREAVVAERIAELDGGGR